jgi:transposase-like protein
MRKQYTAAFKAQLVRQVLKEEKSLNQIASEHGVDRNLLTEWRYAPKKHFMRLACGVASLVIGN